MAFGSLGFQYSLGDNYPEKNVAGFFLFVWAFLCVKSCLLFKNIPERKGERCI